MEKDSQKHLNSIITTLNENEDSVEFRLPVDYKGK